MTGKIIKAISGFYYVHVQGAGMYECRAKGIFRQRQIKPLVGDDARIAVLDEDKKTGNVEDILPRKNALIRPAVANVDQAVVIFAMTSPEPNFGLLNRFLVSMEHQGIASVICFNKADLCESGRQQAYADMFCGTGYPCLFVSAKDGSGLEGLREVLSGRTSTVAGPSGVGKSSLINRLQPSVVMQTGQISEKIGRGRHTTRHSEMILLPEGGYILDTPGFSSIYLPQMEKEHLQVCFPEFADVRDSCRFHGCMHDREPDCAVREAVEAGRISGERYEAYLAMLDEIAGQKRYG